MAVKASTGLEGRLLGRSLHLERHSYYLDELTWSPLVLQA